MPQCSGKMQAFKPVSKDPMNINWSIALNSLFCPWSVSSSPSFLLLLVFSIVLTKSKKWITCLTTKYVWISSWKFLSHWDNDSFCNQKKNRVKFETYDKHPITSYSMNICPVNHLTSSLGYSSLSCSDLGHLRNHLHGGSCSLSVSSTMIENVSNKRMAFSLSLSLKYVRCRWTTRRTTKMDSML